MGRIKIDIVKQPMILVVISFIMILALIIARALLHPYPAEAATASNMPLGRLADGMFAWSMWLSNAVSAGIIFLSALTLTRLIDKYYVCMTHTYLPLTIYLVSAYGMFVPIHSVSAMTASLLLVLSSERMIAGFKRSHSFGEVFKSAFCLGIIPLLYSPATLIVLLLPVMLMLYNRIAREAIVALAALFAPLFLCSAAYWMAGYEWNFIATSLWDSLFSRSGRNLIDTFIDGGIYVQAFAGFFVLLSLSSVVLVAIYYKEMGTRLKKIYIHFILLLIVTIGMAFLPSSNISSLGLMAVPTSLIAATFFIRNKEGVSLLVYLALLTMVLFVNLQPFMV